MLRRAFAGALRRGAVCPPAAPAWRRLSPPRVSLQRRACGGVPTDSDGTPLVYVEGQRGAPGRDTEKRLGGTGMGTDTGELALVFQCTAELDGGKKCGTQAIKRFSKVAYTKGVVIIECPGCKNKHVIADNLGWFHDGAQNIEDLMKQKGETLQKVSVNQAEFDQFLKGSKVDTKSGSLPKDASICLDSQSSSKDKQ
eukprot:Hpha_TRINITY_DN16410_c0_g1::TRINITY_DN16410_c0_g1_i1::g.162591::m.162591/K17808/ZIM17, DNLZ, Tim15; mitochondrial protein import protein ZIM17